AAGTAAAEPAPKTMVAPESSAGRAMGFAEGIVVRAAGVFMAAALNIMVRPAASSVSGAAPWGIVAGREAAGAAFAGDPPGLGGRVGAANIAVPPVAAAAEPPAGVGVGAGASAGAGAGRVTLNVLLHLPQRMVRPCGPTLASSIR